MVQQQIGDLDRQARDNLSLHDLINMRFGVRTRDSDTRAPANLTTTAAQIVPNDSSRVGLVIVNLGSTNIFYRWGNSPTLASGIFLSANGGKDMWSYFDDFHIIGKELFGIAASGTPEIYVMETLIEPPGS
mgnify:FL=1